MKRLTKKLISSIVILALTLSILPVVAVKAASEIPDEPLDYGEPISVTTYVDENMFPFLSA